MALRIMAQWRLQQTMQSGDVEAQLEAAYAVDIATNNAIHAVLDAGRWGDTTVAFGVTQAQAAGLWLERVRQYKALYRDGVDACLGLAYAPDETIRQRAR